MLDIIILIFLVINIGKLAKRKGLSVLKWRFQLIIAWLGAELFGGIIGFAIFGKDNLFSILLLAITCAVSTYYIITNYLNKLPDVVDEDDVNNIGREQ